MPEWLKGADCKSAAFRYVGSNPTRPIIIHQMFSRPVILTKIKYKLTRKKIKIKGNRILNFFVFNRLRNGVKIIKIKPAKLLIKNRGYRETFVQKSLIYKIYIYSINVYYYYS